MGDDDFELQRAGGPMRMKQLGKDGPEVSAICFGAMELDGRMGPIEESQAIATAHAAIDAGPTSSRRPVRMPVDRGPRIDFPPLNATRSAPVAGMSIKFDRGGNSAAASTAPVGRVCVRL
jgi:hypothetical protein